MIFKKKPKKLIKIKIRIKTPKGHASGTVRSRNWAIIKTLLNLKNKKGTITTNKDEGDDTIIWVMEGTISEMMGIQKRVIMFDTIVSGIFTSNVLKKAVKKFKGLKKDQLKEVQWMLKDMTKIEVLREEG